MYLGIWTSEKPKVENRYKRSYKSSRAALMNRHLRRNQNKTKQNFKMFKDEV